MRLLTVTAEPHAIIGKPLHPGTLNSEFLLYCLLLLDWMAFVATVCWIYPASFAVTFDMVETREPGACRKLSRLQNIRSCTGAG